MRTLQGEIAGYLGRRSQELGRTFTAREWALELGIAPTYLSLIATGERIPKLTLAIAMSRQSGIPIEMFVPASASEAAAS